MQRHASPLSRELQQPSIIVEVERHAEPLTRLNDDDVTCWERPVPRQDTHRFDSVKHLIERLSIRGPLQTHCFTLNHTFSCHEAIQPVVSPSKKPRPVLSSYERA